MMLLLSDSSVKCRRQNPLWLFCAALFLLSFVIRCVLNLHLRTASVYFDELFYLELSQNIWLRGVSAVYSLPLNFTKLLYPLILSPFYAISDPSARMTAISVFNALLISSSLIPAYLLARRVLSDPRHIRVALLLLSVSSYFSFSSTFMAEILFLPLALWGFYFAYLAFSDHNPRRLILLGFWCFLLYLTKEVGAAFFGACLVALLFSSRHKSGKWLSLLAFLLSALIPVVIFRLVLFRNAPYSYAAQLSFSSLLSFSEILKVFSYSFRILSWFLLSCFLLPLTVPLARFRSFPGPLKMLLLMSVAYILFVSFGIGFGVSPYESAQNLPGLRVHLRYFISVPFCLLLLFLFSAEKESSLRLSSREALSSLVVLIPVLVFVLPAVLLWPVDCPPLQYLFLPGAAAFQPAVIVKLIPVLLVGLFLFLLWQKKLPVLRTVILPLVLCAQLLSSWSMYAYFDRDQRVPESVSMEQIAGLDRFLDTLDGMVLVVHDDLFSPELRTVNTYLNDDYYVVSSSGLIDLILNVDNPSAIPLETTPLPNPLNPFMPSETFTVPRIDYIVNFSSRLSFSDAAVSDITPAGITCCKVLAAADPKLLSLNNPFDYQPGTGIVFSQSSPACLGYMVSGFSVPESGFIWTQGNEAILRLKPDHDPRSNAKPAEYIADWTWSMTIGPQHCRISAGDHILFDGLLPEDGRLSFPVPADALDSNGYLTLSFSLPDARAPGNGDERVLAVAFSSFSLSQPSEFISPTQK